jgi:hypothetical protein
MSVDEMSVDKGSVEKLSVDDLSVDELSADNMTCYFFAAIVLNFNFVRVSHLKFSFSFLYTYN